MYIEAAGTETTGALKTVEPTPTVVERALRTHVAAVKIQVDEIIEPEQRTRAFDWLIVKIDTIHGN